MSGDHSVGAIGPIFDSSTQQVGSQDTHCRRATGREALPNIHLGGRHCASLSKPNSCPRGQKGQVRLEALWRCYGGAPEARNSRNHGDQVSKTVFHKYDLYSFSTTPT